MGAFAVLDALAHADDGLGLTALARASGLAKTSTYRLAEQLVALGAVQCIEHRYYIGALIGTAVIVWQITGDGEATVFEGTALIATFLILATVAAFE